jgi:hypothetical protein
VFKLSPPASQGGSWESKVLHHFQGGSDGKEPLCNLILDANGTIYGTTAAAGANNFDTAFSITQ